MGHVDVSRVRHQLPAGRVLFDEVSFRVGEGAKVALVGANGAGKTTLLRLVAGDLDPQSGTVVHSGGLGVMRQFVPVTGAGGSVGTVRDLLVSVAPARVQAAARALEVAELTMMEHDDEPTQLAYAHALGEWGDAGGYDAEVTWDVCCMAALGTPFERAQWREVGTLSGGEQKRLVLEALLRGPGEVLLLDEPDNFLDVPGKRWLEDALLASPKTVLFVSHDRELLARTANRIVTLEGGTAWTHGGGFVGYHDARRDRHARLSELLTRWEEEHERLRALVRTLQQQAAISSGMASRYRAMQTRLRKFEEAGEPPAPPPEQKVRMRLRGGRTGLRAVTCRALELTGLMRPFDLEVFYGERLAVLGSNGSGKSHFLRLLAAGHPGEQVTGTPVAHTGSAHLGARVVPGHFAQTHERPDLTGRTLADVLWREASLQRGPAVAALRRYELDSAVDQRFETLSGGQQARVQILLLELAGTTLLLLDEPTDNLDVASAEALEEGLASFEGTVLAATHDRWFARGFDRFLVFGADGGVYEAPAAMWEDMRVVRPH